MVFFACDQCGESLKKNQVEKHTYRCRSQSFSCIDCQVSFTPTTYQKHVKCISESQKYGSKDYVEKEAKGEIRQNAWCEQVQRAIEFVTEPQLKDLLRKIKGYSNIPRKESKFVNFLTNSCRIRDINLCKLAWAAIAEEASKSKKEEEVKKENEKNACVSASNGASEENETSEISNSDVMFTSHADVNSSSSVNFKWKATIKRKLREAGGEMKIKKLRSSVLNAYRDAVGDGTGIEEIFETKLAKTGVVIHGKLVSLSA